jgi:kynurenine formamidase
MMKVNTRYTLGSLALTASLALGGFAHAAQTGIGKSPWGPADVTGRFNLMTAGSRTATLSRVTGAAVRALSVGYFIGMPSWQAAGAKVIPPIAARGVLIDVAAAKGVEMLPDGYTVTRRDLVHALHRQEVGQQPGDVVLIRTGRRQRCVDAASCMKHPPGMGMSAARFPVEEGGAMIVGADNLSFESFPSEVEGNCLPVHTCLLAEQGTPLLGRICLEALSADGIYGFAVVGDLLKLRGSDGAPIRPVAFTLASGGAS